MNISKHEQRVLHVLALGGTIHFERLPSGKVACVSCVTREGHLLEDCTHAVFDRLRKRGLIRSRGGRPYRATRAGIAAVRSQQDQR
jgi:uncharacterized protein YjhX (UPF0386 family)